MKKKEQDKQQVTHKQTGNEERSSKFNNNQPGKGNDPHADRSAKSERKGAGQEQDSSGSPINS